jgi:peptidoglycan-N-acetylglucosamine deacetylase
MMMKNFVAVSCLVMLGLISCGGNNADKTKTTDTAKAVVNKPLAIGDSFALDKSKRYIYLTWDDAPQPPGSNICKQVFADEGVKATFFCVGMHNYDFRRRSFVDTIRNSYPQFLLANHSYTHGYSNNYGKFYKDVDGAIADFVKAEKEMNIPVKIIRLPGNNSWAVNGELKGPKSTAAVYKKLDSLGYNVIGWDIEWGFKNGSTPIQGAEELAAMVNNKLDNYLTVAPNAMVILAHDRMFAKPQYTDSLRRFIQILKADKRNVFETIDHYPLIKKVK